MEQITVDVQLVTLIALAIAFIIAGASAFASYKNRNQTAARSEWWSNYLQGVSTEMVGAITTAILFSVFVGAAQNTAVLNELKGQLIRNLGSADNATVYSAATEMAYKGWLADGSIKGAYLGNANLQSVPFNGADLRGVVFIGADLRWALLNDAIFDVNTVLPDGDKWTPNTDMGRFWNPDHPDFWRSDDPSSPAYQRDSTEGG